jgi:hypothetical protein
MTRHTIILEHSLIFNIPAPYCLEVLFYSYLCYMLEAGVRYHFNNDFPIVIIINRIQLDIMINDLKNRFTVLSF